MSEEEKKRLKQYPKINKTFNYDLIKHATQLYIIKSLYLCYLDRLAEIKA